MNRVKLAKTKEAATLNAPQPQIQSEIAGFLEAHETLNCYLVLLADQDKLSNALA
jgi:hypothetical protein